MADKAVKSKKTKRFILFRILFRVILLIAAAALILSYSALYINPAKYVIPLFFGLYFIPLLLLNIILLIIALIFRSKSYIITLLVIVPSLLFAERFYKIRTSKVAEDRNALSILSYNVASFNHFPDIPRDSTISKITQQINTINADIVCLQEINVVKAFDLDSFKFNYKYKAYHLRSGKTTKSGIAILSKYEIVNVGEMVFNESTNRSMYADIKIGKDTLRFFNNHLESYSISFKALLQRLRTKDTTSELARDEIYRVHQKIGSTVKRRTHQVDSLSKLIAESEYTTFICGDQNETPMSYAYTTFAKNHNDTFIEAGRGFGATFSLFYPLIRIDYIFSPQRFKVLSHKTLKVPWSDHYPILATIDISP